MKKGFTLIELLIVVVVIAILSSIAFKIGGIGGDSTARNRTVERLQKLENALSGYYAAYGSYPPVQLEGRSRNFYYPVNNQTGIQQTRNDPPSSIDLSREEGWRQVEAACRAQPVAIEFPYASGMKDYVRSISQVLTETYQTQPFDALEQPEQLSGKKGKGEWSETQIFKFGVLSYLLPRYLVMMGHQSTTLYDQFDQWGDNNDIPCRFEDGTPYANWNELNEDMRGNNGKNRWRISLLPTQAVTARWIVNFENSLACNTPAGATVYGVNLKSWHGEDAAGLSIKDPNPQLYSSGDSQSGENGGGQQMYALDKITMRDGWGRELYYYSLPPYQSYRVWSAGPNGRTFPPWVSEEELSSGQLSTYRQLINNWVADDISHLSN